MEGLVEGLVIIGNRFLQVWEPVSIGLGGFGIPVS